MSNLNVFEMLYLYFYIVIKIVNGINLETNIFVCSRNRNELLPYVPSGDNAKEYGQTVYEAQFLIKV